MDRYHDPQSHLVHLQVSPAGGQWCSDGLILAAVNFARDRNLRVQMHMLETQYQRTYAFKQWGKSFIQHLEEIGALGPWLTLAHMVWVEEEDLAILAERGVGLAHNPSSNLRLRSGVAPVPEMVAARLNVGIGMDGQTLDDDQDYLRELRLAWTLANRPGANATTIGSETILSMGTQKGAQITLGSSAALGELKPGYLADLIFIDWPAVQGVWAAPDAPVVDILLRRASRRHVRHVMVNGEWVVRDGTHMTLDEQAIASSLRDEVQRQSRLQRAELSIYRSLLPYLRKFYASWDNSHL
jgi:5-methylthioadenosine/S-adenosylhomocysteine deaminase